MSAHNDAKALVSNALIPRLSFSNDLFFHGQRQLTEEEAAQLRVFVNERLKGKPLAYIIGRKEFWSMEFLVTKETLIPRSDSEVLLETLMEQFHPETPLEILDIGTGTGCLLLSALSEFPHAIGTGIDISQNALDIARKNAWIHKLNDRTKFLHRDLKTLSGLEKKDEDDDEAMYQRFDVVLFNPPYIPRRELYLVGADVLEYEPHVALFPDGGPTCEDTGADPDGLRMYQLLHRCVDSLFRNHAEHAAGSECLPLTTKERVGKDYTIKKCLLMEVGSEDQARSVQKLFTTRATTPSRRSAIDNESLLQFERFLYDASRKCRGVYFTGR
ncbi:unnamed protein product [Peronospora belbahrii]|nr:unnamed protein product [Peronospora belbahrii]